MKKYLFLIFILSNLIQLNLYAQCGCTNCPVDLPDDLNTTFTANINVQNVNNNTLGVNNTLQQVCLDISHDWIGDLDITLIAPDGTSIILYADGNSDASLGGNEGTPFGNLGDDMLVCFSIGATNVFGQTGIGSCNSPNYEDPCNGVTPCYTGNWGTWNEGCEGGNGLNEFNNGTGTVSGVWTLSINDNAGANQGVLNDIELIFANAPDNCNSVCGANVGTITNSLASNDIYLCNNQTLTLTSNDDYTLPAPGGPDDAGFGYAIYNCAPTTGNPDTDPCFTNYFFIGEDLSETNQAGNTFYDFIVANPITVTPTGNDLYFVPITLDDACNDAGLGCETNLTHDLDGDGCYDMGTPVHVTYLTPMIVTAVNNCDAVSGTGSVTLTISGGMPAFNASNFTLTNNGAGTLSATTIANGGSVTINGLNGGDNINIGIADNACTYTANTDNFICGDDVCLINSVLTSNPTLASFPNNQYPPGTTVEFCFEINQYNQTNINFLHGIVPSFGPAWDLTSLTPTVNPSVAANNEAGSQWNWFPGNTVDYNSTNVLIPDAGWWFQSINSPGGLPADPNDSWGDGCTAIVYPTTEATCNTTIFGTWIPGVGCHGDPFWGFDLWVGPAGSSADIVDNTMNQTVCESLNATWIDLGGGDQVCAFPQGTCYGNPVTGMGLTWNSCFEITTTDATSCLPNQDASIEIKTYSDGETGIWTDAGCVPDVAIEFDATLCCIPPPTSAPQSFCENQNINIVANSNGFGTINWFSAATGGIALATNTNTYNPGNLLPGTYTFYAQNNDNGCLSNTRTAVSITVNPLPDIIIDQGDQVICEGDGPVNILTTISNEDNISWDDPANSTTDDISVNPSVSTTYIVTATNACGFVSENIGIQVNEVYNTNFDTIICNGASFTLNGTNYNGINNSGTEIFTANNGCDSVVNVTVTERAIDSTFESATSCLPADTGVVSNPFLNANGCDSIHTITTTLLLSDSTFESATSCLPADTGVVSNPFLNTNGCDSIHTITTTLLASDSTFEIATSCLPADTGVVSNPFLKANGCDSIHTITTTLLLRDSTFEIATSCLPADTGVVSNPFLNTNGCDSIYTITTTLLLRDSTFEMATSCLPADTGEVSNPFLNANGCDSIHTITTTLLLSDSTFETATSCLPADTGVVSNPFLNANGCDSIHTITTTLLLSDSTFENTTSCLPADTGVVSNPFLNANGCDSIHTITTTLLDSDSTYLPITACDSALVNGTWYYTSIVFNENLTNQQGCDSIVSHDLTINSSTLTPPSSTEFNTGSDGSGSTLAGGSDDLLWTVSTTTINGVYNPAKVMTNTPAVYYNSPWPDAAWIAHNNDGTHSVDQTFFYQANFELPCEDCVFNNFCLNLDIFSDNTITEIYVNGVAQSPYGIFTQNSGGYSNTSILTLSFCNDWQAGNNSIIFEIQSSPGFEAFLAQSSINPPPPTQIDSIDQTICDNQFYTFGGTNLNTAGVYNDTLQDASGCDSILVLTLIVNPTDSTFKNLTSCNPSDTGIVVQNLNNQFTCDSIHTITTTLLPTIFNTENITACDSVNHLNNWFYIDTVFNDTLANSASNGCDSIVTYDIDLNYTAYTSDTLNVCDSVFFEGNWYYQEDTVVNTFATANCDSIHTTIINITNSPLSFSEMNLDGNAYQMNGNTFSLTTMTTYDYGSVWFTNAIDLSQSFTLNFELFLGCDDAGADGIAFVLQQNPTNIGASGGAFGFGGITPSLGVEFDTHFNTGYSDLTDDHIAIHQNGVVDHSTNLAGPISASATSSNIEDCAYHPVTIEWNATTQEFDVYFDGVLRLSYTGDIVNTIFNGNSSVYWGVTAATGSRVNDQRIRVNKLGYLSLENDTICYGDTVNVEAALNGLAYSWTPTGSIDNPTSQSPNFYPTVTTEYILELTNSAGCSSFDTMLIVVNPIDSTFEMAASCNPTDTGTVSNPFLNANGCDSIHTITTSLLASDSTFETASSCNPADTGLVSNPFLNANGCDSIHTITTTLLASDSTFATASSCNPADTGTVSNPFLNTNGCDSIHTITTTLLASDSTFATANSCNPADTGTVSNPFLNANGCDSIHTITTNLLASDSTFATANSCNPADTGVVFNPFLNANGCDSIHTITTTLLASDSTFATVSSCNPADTGVVFNPFLNANGCDSIHTITTTLLLASLETINITACDSVDIENVWYYNSTNFDIVENGGAANTCDSTTRYNITINNSKLTNDAITACDSFVLDNITYTNSQFISVTYPAANACDSVYNLDLTINNSSQNTINVELCSFEYPLTLADGSQIDGEVSNHQVRIPNSNACDSIITYNVSTYTSYSISPNYIQITSGENVEFKVENENLNTQFTYNSTTGELCSENCDNYILYPTELVNYYYFNIVDTLNGCSYLDTLKVDIEYNSELNVPNVFTPNGDGQNDIFRAYGDDIVQYQLEIFDRWGGRMFVSNELTFGWDGYFNNLAVESGIYIAIIRATGQDGQKYEITQNIKLVR